MSCAAMKVNALLLITCTSRCQSCQYLYTAECVIHVHIVYCVLYITKVSFIGSPCHDSFYSCKGPVPAGKWCLCALYSTLLTLTIRTRLLKICQLAPSIQSSHLFRIALGIQSHYTCYNIFFSDKAGSEFVMMKFGSHLREQLCKLQLNA